MMMWQPAVERVRNSDGTYDDIYLFDKVRRLDAENKVENVHYCRLLEHTASFIDEVLIALLITSATFGLFFTAVC